MREDERVYAIGEDLLDPYGGAFGITRGLSDKYPDRVVATPISEAAITGVGIGMALRGLRPVIEIMFGDFITLTTDQMVNVAAKLRQIYANQVTVPLVLRTPMGGGRGYGPTHSQTLDHLFLGVPNLHIVSPSHFHAPDRLLMNAILGDDGPVIFSESKLLYPRPLVDDEGEFIQVSSLPGIAGYETRVARNFYSGEPDVGLVTYGGMTRHAETVMARLASEEIRVVCVMPSIIQPLPLNDIVTALEGVKVVLVAEDGVVNHGWGAEVAARLQTALWDQLVAPIARLGASDNVIPAARELEDAVLPSESGLEDQLLELVKCSL